MVIVLVQIYYILYFVQCLNILVNRALTIFKFGSTHLGHVGQIKRQCCVRLVEGTYQSGQRCGSFMCLDGEWTASMTESGFWTKSSLVESNLTARLGLVNYTACHWFLFEPVVLHPTEPSPQPGRCRGNLHGSRELRPRTLHLPDWSVWRSCNRLLPLMAPPNGCWVTW